MWIFGKTPPVEKNKMGKNFGKMTKLRCFYANECSCVEKESVENLFFR